MRKSATGRDPGDNRDVLRWVIFAFYPLAAAHDAQLSAIQSTGWEVKDSLQKEVRALFQLLGYFYRNFNYFVYGRQKQNRRAVLYSRGRVSFYSRILRKRCEDSARHRI